jgi:hypothetical protein
LRLATAAGNYEFTSALPVQVFKVLFHSYGLLMEEALGGSRPVTRGTGQQQGNAAAPPDFSLPGAG